MGRGQGAVRSRHAQRRGAARAAVGPLGRRPCQRRADRVRLLRRGARHHPRRAPVGQGDQRRRHRGGAARRHQLWLLPAGAQAHRCGCGGRDGACWRGSCDDIATERSHTRIVRDVIGSCRALRVGTSPRASATLRLLAGARSGVGARLCDSAVTGQVKMRRGQGAGVSRDCTDAPTSEPFESAAVAASPGPTEGAPATAMTRSPAARSEPITAFALIQRSNSRQSSGDHFRTMSRFSTTPSV